MNEEGAGKDVSEVLSPECAANDPKLHLPITTNPPGPQNPPKQLVWVVSFSSIQDEADRVTDDNVRSLARQDTWAGRSSVLPSYIMIASAQLASRTRQIRPGQWARFIFHPTPT